jgi:hypothetical protein
MRARPCAFSYTQKKRAGRLEEVLIIQEGGPTRALYGLPYSLSLFFLASLFPRVSPWSPSGSCSGLRFLDVL